MGGCPVTVGGTSTETAASPVGRPHRGRVRLPFFRRRPKLSDADLGTLVALSVADLDLLQACAKDRLWLDARRDTAYCDTDDGGMDPVHPRQRG